MKKITLGEQTVGFSQHALLQNNFDWLNNDIFSYNEGKLNEYLS